MILSRWSSGGEFTLVDSPGNGTMFTVTPMDDTPSFRERGSEMRWRTWDSGLNMSFFTRKVSLFGLWHLKCKKSEQQEFMSSPVVPPLCIALSGRQVNTCHVEATKSRWVAPRPSAYHGAARFGRVDVKVIGGHWRLMETAKLMISDVSVLRFKKTETTETSVSGFRLGARNLC